MSSLRTGASFDSECEDDHSRQPLSHYLSFTLMDGLSAAATVLQLLQVAAQVSCALSQYVAAVKGAESSRSKLIDQITLISAAAKAIESVVKTSSLPSRTPEQQAFLTEWFRPDGSPAQCKKELDDLLSWLHSQAGGAKNTRFRFVKRLTWPLRENRIHAAIRAIQEHMPYFHYILSIDTSNRIQEITSIITSEREHTRSKDIAAARHEIAAAKSKLLEWLDGRQKTTGEWIFDERLYMDWRNFSVKLLWLGGKAGAGKSVLASTVIDRLSSGLADDETLAYFYLRLSKPPIYEHHGNLAFVNRPVCFGIHRSTWLSSFSELAMRKERGAGPPVDIATLSDLLRRAARLHQRPMIVIDALDECDDLSKLLHELVKLHGRRTLSFVPNGPAAATWSLRDRLKILSHDLQEEIRDALMEKADGMFRWVQCQLDRLNGCWSLGDVHEVLDTLPATLYETYERILRAIDKQEFGGRVARRALVWLVTTLHPLTLSCLAEALTINHDGAVLGSTVVPMYETDILEVCSSLVSYNEPTGTISLSHYSVKEYLTSDVIVDKTYFVHQTRASLELASVSICSIMLSIDKPDVDEGANDKLAAKWYDLSDYAMQSGLNQLANCVPEDDYPLLGLLFTFQNHVSNTLTLYTIIRFGNMAMLRHYLDHHSVPVTLGDNPLVYAALHGDVPRVQMLLDIGLDVNIEATVPDGVYRSTVVHNIPPLIAAIRNRGYQEEVLTLLIAWGSTVPRDAIHSVLRRDRIRRCKPFIIHIFLQHGADIMLPVAGGNTCLHSLLQNWSPRFASNDDLLEIACLLVGAGCDPTALNDWGISPFHLALSSGCIELVKWLVESGYRLPPDAILHAARCDPRSTDTLLPMLRMLFESGVAIDVRDHRGCSALHTLLGRGAFNVETAVAFTLLLGKGCDIDCQNAEGETPLHLAAQRSELHTVEFLIDRGARLPLDIVNYVAQHAHIGGDPARRLLVCLVQMHGASCQARTVRGNNVLDCLLSEEADKFVLFGYPRWEEPMETFWFLLDNAHGCDFHIINSWGVTVLGTAIENGYLCIARILLARFAQPHPDVAQPDSGDAQGNTLLHRLCYNLQRRVSSLTEAKFTDRTKLLQEVGYDLAKHVNAPNNRGHTPLCIVLSDRKHRPAIVSYLLHLGAKFTDVNPLFLDNLQWASDLPWYCDATKAYQRALARPKVTFDDVDRVYRFLADHCKLPAPAVKRITDTAEYWAYIKVLRENIWFTGISDSEPIALPAVPSRDIGYWIPRRVMFSCKPRITNHSEVTSNDAPVQLLIRRQGMVYAVPFELVVEHAHFAPPTTVFGVWDACTPAVQLNGKQQLAVDGLTSGDTLTLSLVPPPGRLTKDVGRVELEFFQIDMYFTMRLKDDQPASSESQ
ncbi:hypothetical protein BU15DRAFT_83361 [Melanogaster broomeanus]|nr:hypothetical protein BU15DRAFT_83361 [Melanogaster broomeanus]